MAEVSEEDLQGLRVLSTGTSFALRRSWLHSFFNCLDLRVLLLDRNPYRKYQQVKNHEEEAFSQLSSATQCSLLRRAMHGPQLSARIAHH